MKTNQDFNQICADAQTKIDKLNTVTRVFVGMGTCGAAAGAEALFARLNQEIEARGLNVAMVKTGCNGMCEMEPLIDVESPGGDRIIYAKVTIDALMQIIEHHIIDREPVKELALARHDFK